MSELYLVFGVVATFAAVIGAGVAVRVSAQSRRPVEVLEAQLRQSLDARVVIAMRYWRPFTAEAIAELERFAPEDVVLLPLYGYDKSSPPGKDFLAMHGLPGNKIKTATKVAVMK